MSNNLDESDRLTFWRNWYEAIRYKPEKERLEKYDALLAYVFDGVEPPKPSAESPESANAYEIVNFIRATVDISRKRRQIGSRGGAAEKQTRSKTEANAKQNGSKAKANPKQVQEQVQEQEQEHNANSITATRTREAVAKWTVEQFVSAGLTAGVPADFSREVWLDLEARGWVDENGRRTLTSPRAYLKSAWNAEQKKISAARVSGGLEEIPIAR